MADPIRLYSEFTDDLGGDWRVNIHDANFTGTTQTFVLGADGFVLRYSGNNEDRYQPIIGSEVTFTLMEENATHTGFMDDLATAAEQRFSVSIYKDPDGANEFWWGGVLYPEQVVRPFEYYPVANTITAADDLGNLQNIDYNNDGTAYTGQASTVTHLLNCLNKLRSTQLWGATDDFLYYVNDFTASSPAYTGSDLLEDTRISHYGLYNPDNNNENQFYTAFEVLENLAKVFNARIFQAQGKFWFLPVGAQKYSTTLTVEGTYKDGTTITQQSIAAAKSFDSTFERLNGYEYTYLPPLKEVTRTRRYNGNWPLIFDSVYDESDFGTSLSDTDIDYDSGTRFAISGTFNYEFDGDGTTTGNERVGRILLRLRIQVGTKYLKRTATFTGTSNEAFFDPLAILFYTSHEYTATTWESSASEYDIVSPIFDVNEGGSFTIPLFIETPPLAADENGIDVRVNIFGRDDEGNNATAYVATADADYNIVTLRADIFGDTALGDSVEFTATNSDEARGSIDQGEVLFGDAETNNADGIVRVVIGVNAENISEWQSLNHTTTGVGINRLGVQEILGGQRKATRVQRGSVYGSIIYPWQVIDDTDGDYALFQMTYTARDLTNEIEAFLLERDTSTTTGITGTAINDNTPITEDPIGPAAGAYRARLRMAGDGVAQFGSRDQRVNRSIEHRDGGTSSVNNEDLHIVNSWAGPNGSSSLGLPPIAESYGRMIQFHSDSTISANSYVTLRPDSGDTGTTIDGASSYNFNHSYDGITILGHTDDNWYIIQKKDK